MIQKNDDVILTIEDFGKDGEGIGKYDGFTVFVKDAVIGDTIRAKIIKMKKNYGYGKLIDVIRPSEYRVPARCPAARPCGGCQLQFLSYDRQLAYKEEKVRENLERIGGVRFGGQSDEDQDAVRMEPIIGMEDPWHYRNKAQFPVGRSKDGRLVAGFYAGHTHCVIETEECLVGVKENKEVLDIVLKHMEQYDILPYDETTGNGLVRHILIRKGFYTGEIMVCLVLNGTRIPAHKELVEKLTGIDHMTSITVNVNRERGNRILGDRIHVLWGEPYIHDTIGDLKFRISPLSFFQVNPIQTQKLYGKVLEYAALTGKEIVWDLYCGTGTISLFLARNAAKVYGIEVVPDAIRDAERNAMENGITNAVFWTGKAEEVFPVQSKEENAGADVVVVDPPRKGCERSVLDTIVSMNPDRVVYVSCDSATLARDVGYLEERGYKVRTVCPVDMFPHSVHVETVVLLSRESK